jgi:Family of unknown function (DUF5677)
MSPFVEVSRRKERGFMSNVESVWSFNQRIYDLFKKIEKQEGFISSNGWLNTIVYDLYLKTKRSFTTIEYILKSDIPNSYLETLPQLRIILESYLHLSYIRLNKQEKERIEREYRDHLAYQQWRLGKILNEYKRESHQEIHQDYEEYINKFFKSKPKQQKVKHLEYISELARKTKQFGLYAEVYTILSSFVHYNPQTRNVYGKADIDSGTFIYNRYEYDEKIDFQIRSYVIDLTLGVIRNTAIYFDLMDFIRNHFVSVEKKWRIINGLYK